MLKASFEIEVITPLFLAGANQAEAELRPPPFRGAMRYWYRALIGGITGGDLDEVRRREAQVFGETEHGSPIRVRITEVRPPEPSPPDFRQDQSKLGIRYLFWSTEGSSNNRPRRRCCPPGTRFRLLLTAHEKDQRFLQEAIISLWLLTHFGGLGARSRRCAGSLALRSFALSFSPEVELPLLSPDQVTDLDALATLLTLGLQEIKRFLSVSKLSSVENARFDIIAPGNCYIALLSPQNGWLRVDEALEAVGKQLQQYRRSLPADDRRAFGLPLPTLKKRLASPLHLHIATIDSSYVCVATIFKSRLLQQRHFNVIKNFIKNFPEATKREIEL
ncbi:type III-B CRISPR module RAMP protein Cmr1 [Thermogemmatispora onikobensis]|uniref:type III-B CRISPR module RAMP protein Cmr1 n=1 Tax=Thermogemmatispora onikobensis TaxID=732234 RepID=UPI000852B571|nr:type III-B CRISPR module RAMP protein Cmr1 [Thermogemmatispora onikobensis]